MATGDTLAVFTPTHNEPTTVNSATLDVRSDHLVLDFDDSTDEYAVFSAILPRQYKGGGLTVTLIWAASTATTGNVEWTVRFERLQEGADDLDSDSFATAQTAIVATASTSGQVKYTEIAFTNSEIDGLLTGERFRLKITRNANGAGDTMTGDAELAAVEIREV